MHPNDPQRPAYWREFRFDGHLADVTTTITGDSLSWYFMVEGVVSELGRVDEVRKLGPGLDRDMMNLSDAAISGNADAARILTELIVGGRA